MSNIQKRLDALQPYVIGIRYLKAIPIVDAIFKDGWTVPDSDIIQKEKQEGEVNYYMFFTQKEGIGIDELLDYVEKIIKVNVEREKKHELLKVKVKELQTLFSKTPLSKLKNMKFVLGGEELVPEVMSPDFDNINIDEPIIEEPTEEIVYEQKSPEELTDEIPDAEIVNGVKPQDINETITPKQKVELPPKKKSGKKKAPEVAEHKEPTVVCKCGPDDVCPVCIEEKQLI